MLSSRTSRWSAGTALVCLVLLLAAWFLLIAPRRADADTTRAEQASAQQANDLLRVKVAELRAQAAELPKVDQQLKEIGAQLAPVADLPKLIRDVSARSTTAGTELVSITPGNVAPVGSGGAAGQPSAKPGAAPSGRTVLELPLIIVASGDYYQAVALVRQLQTTLDRAMLLSAIKIDKDETDTGSAKVTITLNASVFVMPDTTTTSASTGTARAGAGAAGGTGAGGSAGTGSAGAGSAGAGAAGSGAAGSGAAAGSNTSTPSDRTAGAPERAVTTAYTRSR